jgi:predicted MFS family arabinose efflux permease
MLSVFMVLTGVYMNTQFPFMLRKKDMFNIPESEIGTATSNLAAYSLPGTMVTLFFASYAYEILGRRWTLFVSFFTTSGLYYLIPRAAPDYNKLMVIRCLIGVTMAAPVAHPLCADYIQVNSRGKAIALMGLGVVVGEIFTISIFKV